MVIWPGRWDLCLRVEGATPREDDRRKARAGLGPRVSMAYCCEATGIYLMKTARLIWRGRVVESEILCFCHGETLPHFEHRSHCPPRPRVAVFLTIESRSIHSSRCLHTRASPRRHSYSVRSFVTVAAPWPTEKKWALALGAGSTSPNRFSRLICPDWLLRASRARPTVCARSTLFAAFLFLDSTGPCRWVG